MCCNCWYVLMVFSLHNCPFVSFFSFLVFHSAMEDVHTFEGAHYILLKFIKDKD